MERTSELLQERREKAQNCDLWSRIDKAERADDLQIRVEGLKVGQRYHIRPLIDCSPRRFWPAMGLQTGDYTIARIDYFHALNFSGNAWFQVEGDENWYEFNDWLIFSYVED